MVVLVNRKKKKGKKGLRVQVRPPAAAKQSASALGQALRSIGTALGGLGGSALGVPMAGGVVGNSLGSALSRWLGAGDYSIQNNSIVQKSLKAASSIPSMHSDAQSIVVRHKEFLGEIRSSQEFSVQQSYPLNPGSSTTFPWLSGIAYRFQEYRIRGLVFHYIPTSGNAVSSTNAALGSVMLQTSYRSTDAIPGSKVEMLNEYCSNEVVPSETMAHPIECDPKENPFNVQYIRSGPVPDGETQLMYDLGVTHVAVSGSQSPTPVVLGDLWVTYEVELKKPLIASNVTSLTKSGSIVITSGLLPTSVFGPTPRVISKPLQASVSGNTITFPKGTYGVFQIALWIDGTSLALSAAATTTTGCVDVYPVSGSPFLRLASGTAILSVIITSVLITDVAVEATVTFPYSGTGTLTQTRLMVTQSL
jgi:hypothetical protein